MPSRRELMSPTSTARIHIGRHVTSPMEYSTPSTRFTTPAVTTSALLANVQNDDEAEKKARRRSKVLELQRMNLASPSTPASERRRSMPLNGLSNVQLAEHYADCIKLSTENKITSKNAFGLHLIDYMSDFLKKKELNNFQVASSTLDASAKIYAGRVDAIHTETYKVLTGLGRSNKSDEKEPDTAADDLEQDEDNVNKKQQKRARRSNTIETNLKNINVKKLDTEVEVDPLFSKMSASFDEGGTYGLLMNHLRSIDDSSALAFDSETTMPSATGDQASQPVKHMIELKELRELYGHRNWDELQICPPFADFKFSEWNRNEENTFSTYFKGMSQNDHAFDINEDPEPIPDATCDAGSLDGDNNNAMDYADSNSFCGDGAGDDDYDENSPQEKTLMITDGQEAKMMKSAMNSIKHGTVGTLMQVLASEPSEYSYFKENVLDMWAGPAHWKLKAQSKGLGITTNTVTVKKEKQAAFEIKYEDDEDLEANFKERKRATTLTKSTLDKYSKTDKTLPEDLHYDPEKLFSLFIKPKIMVKRQKTQNTDNMDEGIENYDYENANDRENFCPAIMDGEDDDDSMTGGVTLNDESAAEFHTSQGSILANDTMFNSTQLNGTMLAGDNLVSQPNKVARLEIGYAKTAKKMDVKKLKSCMWDILTTPAPTTNKVDEDADKDETATEEKTDPSKDVTTAHSFQNILKVLPEKLSKNMASNLSVPIAFVCLLHLANEKTLKITSDPDMNDFRITQGL